MDKNKKLSPEELIHLMDINNKKIMDNERKMHIDRLYICLLKYADSDDIDIPEIDSVRSDISMTYVNDDADYNLIGNLITNLENKVFNAKERINLLKQSNKLASDEFKRLQSVLDDY